MTCLQRAYLYVTSEHRAAGPPYSPADLDRIAFDPAQVTALTGLTPTTSWRRHDHGHRFSDWTYELPERRTHDTEEVVTALLTILEPHAAALATARHLLDLQAGIMVVITTEAGLTPDGDILITTPAITYTAETLHRLAALDLSLHHDQYVTAHPCDG
ncbi:DUF4279 domain-containing protein [Actinoplanes sp. N902-109]|uniref:DUF4279 domain-containing protein n=1 Tax=Actinoplanes sp. (strain N902-109) TaxID=649831 RepID=UPI00032958CC|nr:DUF4279 domain-containing protein [Actinoplanes sp. N902-109]AGL13525.1 hypothetical protein L083_0015 [Actinoplanes sp. N902-109]